MAVDLDAGTHGLRTALRDLVALSAIPAAWVGREPSAIAAGLADVLAGSLYLDFAFVRLSDPRGGPPIEMTRGSIAVVKCHTDGFTECPVASLKLSSVIVYRVRSFNIMFGDQVNPR